MALFSKTIPDIEFYPFLLDQSAMFDSASLSLLSSQTSSQDGLTKGTFSAWVKRTNLSSAQTIYSGRGANDNNEAQLTFNASDQLYMRNESGSAEQGIFTSDAVFRDCSSWYHIVFTWDTTLGTNDTAVQVYVNGEQIALTWTDNTVASANFHFNRFDNGNVNVGRKRQGTTNYFNGYMADVIILDNIHKSNPNDFGQTKQGVWVPKDYTGSYGTMGVRLQFADSSNFGDDTSGNAQDWNPNGMGTDHQVLDSPTNNYCVLDRNNTSAAVQYFEEGGLKIRTTNAANYTALATFLMKSGKWYWETKFATTPDVRYIMAGMTENGEASGDMVNSVSDTPLNIGAGFLLMADDISDNRYEAYDKALNETVIGAFGAPALNDILMIAFDADTNKFWVGLNGTWYNSGDPAAGTNATYDSSDGIDSDLYDYVPFATIRRCAAHVNFGQSTFAHTPPEGFKSLCSNNLPTPAIINPLTSTDVAIYEGTGADLEISDLLFGPDFVWIKNRTSAYSHQLYDTDRGATNYLLPDANNVEGPLATGLKSFDADGFTVGSHVGVNATGQNIVAWCLKEGPTSGFDTQTWVADGAASKVISHNLGAVPEMIITKNRTDAYSWPTYHHAAGNKTDPETDYAFLDTNAGWTDGASAWNDTAPTSTEFTVGIWGSQPTSSNYVAYIWRSIPGFSKVFSYYGNGNANGPYVNCGFRPRWMIYKNIAAIDAWVLVDTERDTYNPVYKYLVAQDTTAEGSLLLLDFYSNGFKIRSTYPSGNGNNQTIIGIAFAEQPFKYANAR